MPIKLYPGLPIAQLSFMTLDRPAERPYGSPELGSHYQGQRAATESRYEGARHAADRARRAALADRLGSRDRARRRVDAPPRASKTPFYIAGGAVRVLGGVARGDRPDARPTFPRQRVARQRAVIAVSGVLAVLAMAMASSRAPSPT